jgi:hypothetical protein
MPPPAGWTDANRFKGENGEVVVPFIAKVKAESATTRLRRVARSRLTSAYQAKGSSMLRGSRALTAPWGRHH